MRTPLLSHHPEFLFGRRVQDASEASAMGTVGTLLDGIRTPLSNTGFPTRNSTCMQGRLAQLESAGVCGNMRWWSGEGGGPQVHEPGIDLPIGIVGTVTVCAGLYALMALAIVGMVPTSSIDISAPFSDAFLSLLRGSSSWGVREVLLATSARFVSFGALTGLPPLTTRFFAAEAAGKNSPIPFLKKWKCY